MGHPSVSFSGNKVRIHGVTKTGHTKNGHTKTGHTKKRTYKNRTYKKTDIQKTGHTKKRTYKKTDIQKTGYERCIRETPQLWNSLDNLEDKILGCWCKPSQPCRADVLIKLFNEKKAINDITQDIGIQIDKYEKYETSEDLTADE